MIRSDNGINIYLDNIFDICIMYIHIYIYMLISTNDYVDDSLTVMNHRCYSMLVHTIVLHDFACARTWYHFYTRMT